MLQKEEYKILLKISIWWHHCKWLGIESNNFYLPYTMISIIFVNVCLTWSRSLKIFDLWCLWYWYIDFIDIVCIHSSLISFQFVIRWINEKFLINIFNQLIFITYIKQHLNCNHQLQLQWPNAYAWSLILWSHLYLH